MTKRAIFLALAIGAVLGLGGCKKAAPAKKADAQAWEGTKNEYAAEGWKAGDTGSWEAQMRTRAQSQNEYNRSAPQR